MPRQAHRQRQVRMLSVEAIAGHMVQDNIPAASLQNAVNALELDGPGL
jgi:hypothetical protein